MKKNITIGLIIIILLIALGYIYYPFTQSGCNKLKEKITEQIAAANQCDSANDCSVILDLGCSFECGGYFSNEINQGLISRFNRRCSTCNDECYFETTNPACLNHTCRKTGGAVQMQTEKQEYSQNEDIKIDVTNYTLEEIGFSFPITLCLRPTIMRLEKYNEQTKEWLSSGVGLLFDNSRIIFYQDPTDCPAYKIKNCQPDQAEKFFNLDTLKISQAQKYTITPALTQPCTNNQENLEPMLGRYRIGLYYEPSEGLGEQIYSNEFLVK